LYIEPSYFFIFQGSDKMGVLMKYYIATAVGGGGKVLGGFKKSK
jgi:hypothetical protein